MNLEWNLSIVKVLGSSCLASFAKVSWILHTCSRIDGGSSGGYEIKKIQINIIWKSDIFFLHKQTPDVRK